MSSNETTSVQHAEDRRAFIKTTAAGGIVLSAGLIGLPTIAESADKEVAMAIPKAGSAPVKGEGFFVVRTKAGYVYAVNNRCPHKNCQVAWKSSSKVFSCPCHKSQFNAGGELAEGKWEAKTDLSRHPISIKDGKLSIKSSAKIAPGTDEWKNARVKVD